MCIRDRCFLIQRAVQRENIRLREKLVEGAHSGDADGFVGPVGKVGIVENDAKAEGFGAEGRCGADAPQANDAEGESAEAAEFRRDADVPAELFGFGIQRQDLAAQRHGESDGMVGDFFRAIIRHVAHGDATLACGSDVHACLLYTSRCV